MKKNTLSALFTILISVVSFGQADIWYVGSNIKMDFSEGGDPIISAGITIPSGTIYESSATLSNPKGELIFSAVGDKIYDGSEEEVFTLDGINGDMASQAYLILPVSGTSNEYWLTVLVSEQYGTSLTSTYYKVTATTDDQNDVITGQAGNISVSQGGNLSANLSEVQGAVPKANNPQEFWLVTHEVCNNSFKVFSVTAAGINLDNTYQQGTAFDCSNPLRSTRAHSLKFNNCYDKLVLSSSTDISLYDFNNETGEITFVNSTTAISNAYGLEFSPNSAFLYVLQGIDNSQPGTIYRIPITSNGLASVVSLGDTDGLLGGHLQLAPDGNIYYPIKTGWTDGFGKIGRITEANNGGIINNDFYQATAQEFDLNTFDYVGENQWVSMDLPNFVKSFVTPKPTLKVNDQKLSKALICENNTPPTIDFTLGKTSHIGTNWASSSPNEKLQNTGTSFVLPSTKNGTTTIYLNYTDFCGVAKSFSEEIGINENQVIDVFTDCSSNIIAEGALADNYKWYTTDPDNLGVLIATGKNFDANNYGEELIWVTAAGNFTETELIDPRVTEFYRTSEGATVLNVQSELVEIKEFKTGLNFGFSSNPYEGNYFFTLKQGQRTIGTPVNHVISCNGTNCLFNETTIQPVDWLIEKGEYTIEITKSTSLDSVSTYKISSEEWSTNAITISGGPLAEFKVTAIEEEIINSCATPISAPIPYAPSIIDQPANQTICVGNSVSFSLAADPITASITWQKSTNYGLTWESLTNSNEISGVHTNELLIQAQQSYNQNRFRAQVSNTGCTTYTDEVNLTVRDNVVALATTLCNTDDGYLASLLGDNEYQIVIDILGGDLSSINIEGATFTNSPVAYLWYSEPINEETTVDLFITDDGNCNSGYYISGINRKCEVITNLNNSKTEPLIYPTLVEEYFSIKSDDVRRVQVLDQEGNLLKSFDKPKEYYTVSELKAGIYMVKIISSETIRFKKIIIK